MDSKNCSYYIINHYDNPNQEFGDVPEIVAEIFLKKYILKLAKTKKNGYNKKHEILFSKEHYYGDSGSEIFESF